MSVETHLSVITEMRWTYNLFAHIPAPTGGIVINKYRTKQPSQLWAASQLEFNNC